MNMEQIRACECRGCRGISAHLNDVWQWRQIPDKINGHYFDESTRRFFSSRINEWRHFDDDGLAVRESSAGDMDNTFRVHRVVTFCRYGELVNTSENFTTGKAAQAFMESLPAIVSGCGCHGCERDEKAGE